MKGTIFSMGRLKPAWVILQGRFEKLIGSRNVEGPIVNSDSFEISSDLIMRHDPFCFWTPQQSKNIAGLRPRGALDVDVEDGIVRRAEHALSGMRKRPERFQIASSFDVFVQCPPHLDTRP